MLLLHVEPICFHSLEDDLTLVASFDVLDFFCRGFRWMLFSQVKLHRLLSVENVVALLTLPLAQLAFRNFFRIVMRF